jgi:hypothetical protein
MRGRGHEGVKDEERAQAAASLGSGRLPYTPPPHTHTSHLSSHVTLPARPHTSHIPRPTCTSAAMGSFMRHVAQPCGPSAVSDSRYD